MDRLFWKPGWQESSGKVEQATSGPLWVLDGNYTRTLAIKRVQLVVWLDPSFAQAVLRVTARTVPRARARREGGRERGTAKCLGGRCF